MRCCVVAVVGLVAVAGCGGGDSPDEEPAPEPWKEFVGRDLGTLEDGDKARLRALRADLPRLIFPGGWDPPTYPLHLWRHERVDGTEVIILFEAGVGERPGRAAVRFLDPAGPQLAAVPFYAGWKVSVEDAAYRVDPAFGALVDVQVRPGPNGPEIWREVYATDGSRLTLVRLEGADGTAARNTYVHPERRIGPAAPDRTAEQWAGALAGIDRVEALAALTWLGGCHYVGGQPQDPGAEDEAAVERVRAVRRHPDVRAAVRRLAEAEHQWVREAAQLAVAAEGE